MSVDKRFTEAIEAGMEGHTIEADSRGRVLHFEPFVPYCDTCGSEDTTGDQVELDAGDTTIRLCPDCQT